ncbi:hypothetical protein [Halomonas sp. M20]|uniref:hypothetical protein n=1 Tax=Halomonas sp. M20 TaxID=2763264 RepID=UPI001D0A736B|nr:hypothetical protein [Halomonas sp. M20]
MNKGQACRAILSAAIAVSLTWSAGAVAAEPVGPRLTEKLRGLLVKEMVEIESAMQETYSAIIQGKHDEVAQKGQAIHDSFILEQSLTEQDRQDLMAAVPKEFLQMDERLHQLAASLAEAGKQQDSQAQVETFNRMTESCVACHSRYVTDRFEGLEGQSNLMSW